MSRAAALLIITTAAFGGTWVAAPWATEEVPPLVVACARFGLAAVLLAVWCLARGLPLRLRRADVPVVLGSAATAMVGYNVLFLYGVTLAPASHGAVIVPGLIPMMTLLLGRAFLRLAIVRRQVMGIGLSLFGLALVVGPELTGDPRTLAGDLLFTLSAGLWAIYTLLGRTATSRLDPSVLNTFAAAIGALVFLPLALVAPGGPGDLFGASSRALGSIAYLGSIGTALSFVTFLLGVRLIGAARASAYTVLVPVFGLTLTVSLLGEPLGPLSVAGAIVVVAGLWLTQTARPRATGSPAVARAAEGRDPA